MQQLLVGLPLPFRFLPEKVFGVIIPGNFGGVFFLEHGGESPLGPGVPLECRALDAVVVLAPAVGASGLGEVGLGRDPWFTLARALVRLV